MHLYLYLLQLVGDIVVDAGAQYGVVLGCERLHHNSGKQAIPDLPCLLRLSCECSNRLIKPRLHHLQAIRSTA